MTTTWLIAYTFEAENVAEAERFAAVHMDGVPARGGLSYKDPLTGKWVLWSEPIERPDSLAIKRQIQTEEGL